MCHCCTHGAARGICSAIQMPEPRGPLVTLRSATARIAIALFLAQLASAGIALLVIRNATDRLLSSESRDFAEEMQLDLRDAYTQGGSGALRAAIAQRVSTTGAHDAVIGLRSGDGTMLAGNVEPWPRAIERKQDWQVVPLLRKGEDAVVEAGVMVVHLPDHSVLVSGDALEEEQRVRAAGEQALVYALLLGAMLSIIGTFFLARYIGRKVQKIATVADQVADGNLTGRIDSDGSGDAFDKLGDAFNHMLGRVENLVSELRLVTDSLSHDLRSPVARVKATLESALASTKDEKTQLAIGSALDETDRLNNMLAMALQISRAEAGLGRDQFSSFPANGFIEDLAEVYGPLAEERGMAIHAECGPDFDLFAHRQLLTQSVANLIDNALKYADGSDRIDLSVGHSGGHVAITVADKGPGISLDRHEEALKRFGRLDASRHAAGAGLGLSLVSTVAHLHGGRLVLEDNGPGLKATLLIASQ